MSKLTRYVIIDDDEFNNKICTVTLEKLVTGAEITTFLDPIAGFHHLAKQYAAPGDDSQVVVFLDINMPVMNGWEFLERFEALESSVKDRIKIYILSSSVDKRDMERAHANRNVIHYLVKPLTKETIRLINHSHSRERKP